MSDDRYDRGSRRESLMQQRLRRSRGEEIEDNLDDVGPYDDDDAPRGLGGGGYSYPPPRGGGGGGGGGGCAQATLYLVLGGLIALLIGAFFINRAFGSIGQIFSGPPDFSQIIITPTPEIVSGAAVVQRIRQLSRLETSQYTIERVIDVNQSQGNPLIDFFAGDTLLLIAHGSVVAGIDLSQLDESAVTVAPDGSSITVQLPPVEIFSAALDSGRTRVYTRERGIFAPENTNLETLARQEAEQLILQAACEDGIMQRGTEDAVEAMEQFLSLLDFQRVVVLAATPGPCQSPVAP